jgi:hypothetical protein
MAVGAGGALTGGVKRLPPVGLMLFSVDDTGGAEVVLLVVVVVVVLDGLGVPPPPQAVSVPIATTAAMPKPAATRRVRRRSFMMESYVFSCVLAGKSENEMN